MEKKVYETPVVTKVEFDASDRITASVCSNDSIVNSYVGCNSQPVW